MNPLLALQPQQGVKDLGNIITQGGNGLFQALQNRQQSERYADQQAYQNQLLDMRQEQHAQNADLNAANLQQKNIQISREQGFDLYNKALSLQSMTPEQRQQALTQWAPDLLSIGFTEQDLQDGLDDGEVEYAVKALSRFAPQEPSTAAIQEFEAKAAAAGLEPGSAEYIQAAKVDLGLEARKGSSAQERIALDPSLTNQVAQSQAVIEESKASGKESGKLEVQAKLLPQIRSAIKAAETQAADQGETLTAYKRAEAAMPGLREVVGKLKSLSDIATYTLGGRAFDEVSKQLGFGSTKGATARAKIEAIVDNQVLPLLRETFGAAFTAAEGERLRNTLLDINATPESKKATLDAFLEQKMRNLEAQERELTGESVQASALDSDLLEFMSPEERALFE